MLMQTAIYPGSFDPITLGHVDIIERSAKFFDKVLLVIANNSQKAGWFNVEDRLALCQQALSHLGNIEYHQHEGLTIDFAKQHDAQIILRGVRTAADVDFEMQLANMNRSMENTIETFFIPASQQHTYISSSLIKEIAKTGKSIQQFLPKAAANAVKEKLTHVEN